MNVTAQLTKRELEVAEYLAWGASKKEVSDLLPQKKGKGPISVRTVEVLTKSIYEKLGIQKVSELSVWYFCTHYNISLDLSPLKRRVATMSLLLLVALMEVTTSSDFVRPAPLRASKSAMRSGARKTRREGDTLELTEL